MPVVGSSAYNTAGQITSLVRSLLNDAAGNLFTDGVLLPYANAAYHKVQRALGNVQAGSFLNDDVLLVVSAVSARARAYSWGLMQVMGQVAREHGFAGASLAALCDPATCLAVGCRVLAAKIAAAEVNVAHALLLWNGGANPNYAAAVLGRAPRYKLS